MKKTSVLELVFSQHIPKDVVILHPNVGFELGMMTKTHCVQWCNGIEAKDFLQGLPAPTEEIHVDLRNDCPHSQIQMNARFLKFLGEKSKAVILYDGTRLFIHTV